VESSAIVIKRLRSSPSSTGVAHHGAERRVGNVSRHVDVVRGHDRGANRHVKVHGHPGLMLGKLPQAWCTSKDGVTVVTSTVNDGREAEGLKTWIRRLAQLLRTTLELVTVLGNCSGGEGVVAAAVGVAAAQPERWG